MKKKQESNLEAKDIWQVRRLSNMDSQYTAAWACWHVDLNNAAVQWGWSVETRPKPSFQISLTWQVSTRVRVVEIQLLVQYWIKTVCCRSKYHFHWTAPCTRWSQKWGTLSPTPSGCAAHALLVSWAWMDWPLCCLTRHCRTMTLSSDR